ncbi:hypothetical protein, partial [Photobacterium leiognathi]|uniref:hypothetical protein n=1 Tax=Photobacterium leiognathi TaxID=553611 RepID=UPI002734E5BC
QPPFNSFLSVLRSNLEERCFNQVIPTSVSSFRIYRETLSRFSCILPMAGKATGARRGRYR